MADAYLGADGQMEEVAAVEGTAHELPYLIPLRLRVLAGSQRRWQSGPSKYRRIAHWRRRRTTIPAMEYVAGLDLKRYIKENAPLSNEEAVRLMGQILLVIGYLPDRRGIIHRDLKPQNVLLTPDGTAKVSDLGLQWPRRPVWTQTDLMLGVYSLFGPDGVDRAIVQSDIYAMGHFHERLIRRTSLCMDSAVTIG